jgi:PAS domain S-box-containing protein
MLDHLPVAVILSLRIEQKMLYQNPRFIELFGHTFEEFSEISEWWSIAYPDPEYREWVSKEWNSRLAEAIKNQSEIEPMEVNITAKDGSTKHVCVHGTVLGDMNFITFIDMTQRKNDEEAMRSINAYNRSLIEASLDALITIDSQGIIIDVNSATERATGYSRGQLTGTDIFGYFTDSEKVKNAHNKVLKEGTIEDCELELKHKDGYATTVICNASVHKGKCGRVKGVFISARDITQRKIREEELERQKLVAEEANVLKSQFLATMSHELRTPVNVIFSAIQLFQLYLKNSSDVASLNCSKHLKAMKQNCYRLLRLINNLIDITKIGAGFMEYILKM